MEDDQPLFGEIQHCLVTKSEETLFVVTELNTICLDEHYHSWEVSRTNIITVATPNQLIDHHPLHLIKISAVSFVCLKYQLMSSI